MLYRRSVALDWLEWSPARGSVAAPSKAHKLHFQDAP